MIFEKIALNDTGLLPLLVSDYLIQAPGIKSLYQYTPNIDNFEQVIKDKHFDNDARQILLSSLQKQYKNINASDATMANIESLSKENTFTITTAHQPLLLGGPAYFIYKIASAIKACILLKAKYPNYHFVPIYWMGSEDHDFDEVNHLYLFNKKFVWERESQGPVGRLILDQKVMELIAQVADVLGQSENALGIQKMIKDSFQENDSLAMAIQRFVNTLFAQYGLVILNQDDKSFKASFSKVIKEELTQKNAIQLIQDNLNYLSNHYKIQASPREINLFYLTDQSRERIIFEKDKYKVKNTEIAFTEEEILKLVDESPDKFSPNVILRPLYQEMILPNLAFVGGAGELSYWLQLKPIFDHYKINYPMLLMRDTATIWDEKSKQKFLGQGFQSKDIFLSQHELERQFVASHADQSISLQHHKDEIIKAYEALSTTVTDIDKTLLQSVEAEKQKLSNGIDILEAKLLKAYKRKYDEDLAAIKNAKEKIFPENSLQERHDSLLMYLNKYGPSLIDELILNFNIFQQEMSIIS